MRKILLFLLSLLVLTSFASAATIYKWVDKEGVVNFTDDYSKVPPEYRDQVQKEVTEDLPRVESQAPARAPEKAEEPRTDIYGLGESYWRDRARRWNEQLKEATANYESVNKKIIERSETLSRKYWSPTQYKMNMVELERLKEERWKYQGQINEANEMLKKLSKEAEEAKANPDWLK